LAGNTILVVDDDPLICRSLEFMLDNYVSVQVASDGQTALEKTEQTLPDVVLSDVDMPGMNGLELSKALLNTPATCHIPILFISARNGDKDRLLGLQSGAIDYIAKPFSQTELLIKLVNMLRLRQRQQQRVLDSVVNKTTQGAPSEEGGENVDMDPFLSSFKEMVERDFADKQMQLDTMAEKMNVSQSTLSRKIKALTGKSPVDVLTSFRLNRAKQMLETASSEVQIIDIALAVGFNDSSYFTRKFREKFGYTPSKLK
jgi:two-component system sensor histidine kinase ChiS